MTMAREVGYAPCPAYKISKAALNALMVQYALSYEEEGFVFLAVSPGVGTYHRPTYIVCSTGIVDN